MLQAGPEEGVIIKGVFSLEEFLESLVTSLNKESRLPHFPFL